MFKPLSLCIGFRYTRAKRRNRLVSFIALSSMLGIAVGVMALVVVLSVMNGFDDQIRQRFFAIAPEVTVMTPGALPADWQDTRQTLLAIPGVSGVAPYVSGKGMLLQNGNMAAVQVVGIDPVLERSQSEIARYMQLGQLSRLQPGQYRVILGRALARQLGVSLGDRVTLATAQTTISLAGVFPRYRSFVVAGIFHTSEGFDFDRELAYIQYNDATRLFGARAVSGFHIKVTDLYRASAIREHVAEVLSHHAYQTTDWTMQFGAFFQALAMEKTMLFLILSLIVAVAVFNLVASLVMVVNDKRADIAILRTLGASPGLILRIVIVQGMLIGSTGLCLGMVLGLIIAAHATGLANAIQHLFGVQWLQSSVYFLDYLPSKIQGSDLMTIALVTWAMSLLATLYPARMAVKAQPAEALRYE